MKTNKEFKIITYEEFKKEHPILLRWEEFKLSVSENTIRLLKYLHLYKGYRKVVVPIKGEPVEFHDDWTKTKVK